ncbi:MAG: hypothetical protein A3F68_05255 [Acidobacteria bacterium RIFCSPLOWO2_12_FULL_54_10]|nr:MAG: hypothetical protein A3F68_05255 [Acidobacteria bacterium RIFCSPLOWO2_12_FULL_54_10]
MTDYEQTSLSESAGDSLNPGDENPIAHSPQPSPAESVNMASKKSLIAKLTGWFQSEPVAETAPETPRPTRQEEANLLNPDQPLVVAAPQSAPEQPGDRPQAQPIPRQSAAEQVMNRLHMERIQAEMEDSFGKLQAAQKEIEHLKEQVANESNARQELETRIRALSKSLELSEMRLAEEKEKALRRINELESECDQLSSQIKELGTVSTINSTNLHQQVSDLQLKTRGMEAQLDVTSRDLQDSRSKLEEQLRQAQEERGKLERQLVQKEKDLEELRKLNQEAVKRMGATDRMEQNISGPSIQPQGSAVLSPEAAADFHQKSMSTLTVMLACADLLAMNSGLDQSSKDLAVDIRKQGQILIDLVKSITIPENKEDADLNSPGSTSS